MQRTRLQTVYLSDMLHERLVHYAETGELDQRVRDAFRDMAMLRSTIDLYRDQLSELHRVRDRIFEEQERIRENLPRVREGSDLHARYLAKLGTQEDELERLAAAIDETQAALDTARQVLKDYIARLEL